MNHSYSTSHRMTYTELWDSWKRQERRPKTARRVSWPTDTYLIETKDGILLVSDAKSSAYSPSTDDLEGVDWQVTCLSGNIYNSTQVQKFLAKHKIDFTSLGADRFVDPPLYAENLPTKAVVALSYEGRVMVAYVTHPRPIRLCPKTVLIYLFGFSDALTLSYHEWVGNYGKDAPWKYSPQYFQQIHALSFNLKTLLGKDYDKFRAVFGPQSQRL